MTTRRAMDIVGISHEEQEAIFRTLAAILHLGNIEFSPGKEHDSSVIKDQKATFHMEMAANLFMCDVNILLATICTRSIQTYEGIIVKALDCNAAVASRDALAKTVYARLFDWLVEKINRSVGQDKDSRMQIGVLDIYGFECFKNNSFEQFCINFANEKLQQHFNEHVFKMEQEEYRKEQINWSYIEFIDNQDVLDLIEKRKRTRTQTQALELAPWSVLRAALAFLYHPVEAMKVVKQLGKMGQRAGLFVHRSTKGLPSTADGKYFGRGSRVSVQAAVEDEINSLVSGGRREIENENSWKEDTMPDRLWQSGQTSTKYRKRVKPIGIIALLDEACMFPKSTHETFSTKLFQNFRAHLRLEKAKFSETDFTMSHYAGKACHMFFSYCKWSRAVVQIFAVILTFPILVQVTYQTNTFLDKNRDYVVVEHCNLLCSSKCPFIAGLFLSLPEESSRSSYKFSSVASRFKQQLQALMETLNSTEPHYIRCVKPNSLNRPLIFENKSILHQLRCGGVLEAVRISLAGYPTRKTYHEFVDRFGLIALEVMDESYDEKTTTEKILQKLKLENYQMGKTKVFLRAGQIGVLDSRRSEVLDTAAKHIQSRLRTYVAHRDFVSTRLAAVSLQACCRGCLARNGYAALREAAAAILIQKYVRRWLLMGSYLKLHSSTVLVQSCICGFLTRQRYLHRKEHRAATLIQEANETGALRLAKNKLEKQLEDLAWRLQLEKKLRVSNEEAKLMEFAKLQKTVDSLSLELDAAKLASVNECNKNAVLKNQLELSIKEKSALEREIVFMAELRNENAFLKNSLNSLENKNSVLQQELIKAKEDTNDTIKKLKEVEKTCSQLQQNLQSLEEKLCNLEDENHVLRQKTLSASPKGNRPGSCQAIFGEVLWCTCSSIC
ncbi:myosin [Actinidia rufa]|uniref:Myosin n=1 Tax=Actinidia rufa TaxID=165716 RepID=A0A7J0DQW2_9ERIC|nr:myosin [Actinidia rufa]